MEWNGTLFSAHLMHDKASSDDESSSWIRDNNGNKKQQKVIKCIARERKTERMAGSVCDIELTARGNIVQNECIKIVLMALLILLNDSS